MIEQEKEVHLSHCNMGDYEGTCKYGDPECPALDTSTSLTDDEIDEIWDKTSSYMALYEEARRFARAIIEHVNKKSNPSQDHYTLPPLPVMEHGGLKESTIRINGSLYRCSCGCNVFHQPDDTNLDLYQCNACGQQFWAT